MLCLQAKLQSFIIFSLKIDILSMKSFCLFLLSCHSSLHRLEAPSPPHTTRLTLSSIKSGSSNCPGTPSLSSSADESNASSGIPDLNCDLNGLNTAKVIRDTNSKPRNSEIYIVVLRSHADICQSDYANNNSTVGPNNSRLTHIFYHHGVY